MLVKEMKANAYSVLKITETVHKTKWSCVFIPTDVDERSHFGR